MTIYWKRRTEMENSAFVEKLNRDGASMYRVSRETGIPYTTIQELVSGKNDINRCPYETVARLSAYFRCSPSELANPVQYVANIHGTYRKIPYRWIIRDGTAELHIRDGQSDVVLMYSAELTQARFSREYFATTLCLIDRFLRDKEVQELLCHCDTIF
jgi:hypothetical protein